MAEVPLPEFEQLQVISDLHIGGEAGFQLFTQAALLSQYLRHLREQPVAGRVALLINGDMIDFLAEPPARCFDPFGAAAKLDRIFTDAVFQPVWTELRNLLKTANRYLIINLGNHDLELALPWVRNHLVNLLTQGDEGARGRLTLVTDGTGYACNAGGKRVLCLHGNEVDTWNVADFDMIRCIGRDVMHGRTVQDWTPNAGTRLVVDVMNEIKRKYAFVDLLKPEVQAVIPVLVALDEAQVSRLQRIVGVASRLSWDKVRRATGFLSQGEEPAPTPLEVEEGAPWFRRERPREPGMQGRMVFERSEAAVVVASAEENFRSGVQAVALVDPGAAEQLGAFGAGWEWARGKSKEEVLYAAVRDLEKDRSFDIRSPDEAFRRIDKFVGPNFDYVVTGHTHMERELRREHGAGMYFNTGSWVPRIRFTRAALSSMESFRPVFEALKSGRTISDLAGHSDLVIYKPLVLSIGQQASGSVGAVMREAMMTGNQVAFGPAS